MNSRSQFILGVFGAFCLALIVAGSSALALVESGISVAALPEQVMAELEFTPAAVPVTPLVGKLLRPTHKETAAPEVADLVEEIPLQSDQNTECLVPADWVVYVIQVDDNLESIARRFGVSLEALTRYNCLQVKSLVAGATLYVPPGAAEQVVRQTSLEQEPVNKVNKPVKQKNEKCNPPAWWVRYRIQPGDTLYGIGLSVGVTVRELQKANCMGTSTLLRVGQSLYVPALPVAYSDPPASSSGVRRSPQPSSLPPTPYPTERLATPYPTWVASPPPTEFIPPTLPPGETSVPSPTEETQPPAPTEETPSPAPTEETQPPAPTEETPSPAPTEETQPPAPTEETQPPAPTDETQPPAPTVETQPPAPTVETQPPAATEEPLPPPSDEPPPPDEPSPPAETEENQPGPSDETPAPETGMLPSLRIVNDLQGLTAGRPYPFVNHSLSFEDSPPEIDLFTIWHNQWYYALLMLVIILFFRRL